MEITITEFKEQYLPELRDNFHTAVQNSIVKNSEDIKEKINKEMAIFVGFVGNFQRSVPVEVGEIQIALLYSSVCMGEPQICISAYGKRKILGNEILNIKFRCDWLFTEWETYEKNIEEKIKMIHAENCIRKSAVKMMMNDSMFFLIYILYAITKYQLMEFDRVEGYEELILDEDFRLSVGGYRDWSRTIYNKKDEIDIFFRDSNTTLKFCVFNGAVYNKKKFKGLDLSHTRFYECEFNQCEFEDVMLKDSIFDNCRIQNCSFKTTNFYGATFRQCTMKKNRSEDVNWVYEADLEFIEDIYKNVDFIECINDGSILERGDA